MRLSEALITKAEGMDIQFNLWFVRCLIDGLLKDTNPKCKVVYLDNSIYFYDKDRHLLAKADK
jgi:hypothetical protein